MTPKEKLEVICRGHSGSYWEPLYKDILNEYTPALLEEFVEWYIKMVLAPLKGSRSYMDAQALRIRSKEFINSIQDDEKN